MAHQTGPSSQTAASVRGTFVPHLTEQETWCGLALQACCCSFCCRYSASATVACTANSLFPEQTHPVTSCLLLSSIVSSYFVPEKNDQPGQRRGPRFLHKPLLLYLWGQHVFVFQTDESSSNAFTEVCVQAAGRLQDHAGLRGGCRLVFLVIAGICVYLCAFYQLFQNEFFFVSFVIWMVWFQLSEPWAVCVCVC